MALVVSGSLPLRGQIAQTEPGLSGNASKSYPIPFGVPASVDALDGKGKITLDTGRHITLPGIQQQILQVWSIGTDGMIVFGGPGSYNINIAGMKLGEISDSFFAYDPASLPISTGWRPAAFTRHRRRF